MLGQIAFQSFDVLLTFDQEAQSGPDLTRMVVVDIGVSGKPDR